MSLTTLQYSYRLTEQLPADPLTDNVCRSVENAVYSWVTPTATTQPKLINVNEQLAKQLGLSEDDWRSLEFTDLLTGNALLDNMQPYALCYGGHQFGQWAGQLGDGRAINLSEIKTTA